jgi:MFS transporter, MHS family, proline/betaine transporter
MTTLRIKRDLEHRSAFAGAVGNALEWYDFTIYGFGAHIIGRLFFPAADPVVSLLATYGVFASAFLVRPLGSLFFGHVADRYGRTSALTLSVGLMAVSTVCIGLLPTYAALGVAAPVLLIVCRLLQGLSVGGEFTTSITFLGERCPPGRRGLYCALPSCTIGVGQMLGSLVFFLMEASLPQEAVLDWGWRIPFLFGIVLGAATLWLRRAILVVDRPPPVERALPIVEAIRSEGRAMLCGFLISVLAGVGIYLGVIYLRGFLVRTDGLTPATASGLGTIGTAILIVLGPVFGALSDRVGRRPVMVAGAAGFILLAWPIFRLLTHADLTFVLAGEVLYMLVLAVYIGPLGAMLTELFSRRVRGSGSAVSYNLALGVFGGTTPAILVYLVAETHWANAAPLWLALAAALGLAGVLLAPERAGEPLRP